MKFTTLSSKIGACNDAWAWAFEDGVVMMGTPGPDFRNPKNLGQITSSLYIYVDDVDAHCARAREAGAEIIEEPGDQPYGDRRYGACDPEGHHWYFATRP